MKKEVESKRKKCVLQCSTGCTECRLHCAVRPLRQWNEFAYSNCLSSALCTARVVSQLATASPHIRLHALYFLSFSPPPPFQTFCIHCLASFAFKLLTNYSQNILICLRMQTVANPNQLLIFLLKYFSNISNIILRKYPSLLKCF